MKDKRQQKSTLSEIDLDLDYSFVALCCIVIILISLTFASLYQGHWDFVYEWDDRENFITNNCFHGLDFEHVKKMSEAIIINVYEPISWFVKAIIFHFVGLNAQWFRVVALALHLSTTIILMTASISLLDKLYPHETVGKNKHSCAKQSRFRKWGCLLSATLYCIHPVNMEVIAWPSCQSYSLSGFFSALSIYFYLRYTSHKHCLISDQVDKNSTKAIISQPKRIYLFRMISPVFYLCGVLSKSVCILLPFSYILIDISVFTRRKDFFAKVTSWNAKFRIEKIMSYCWGKLDYILVFFLVVLKTISANTLGASPDIDIIYLDYNQRFIKAILVMVDYMRRYIYPSGLRPHYQVHAEDMTWLGNVEVIVSIVWLLIFTLVFLLTNKHLLLAWAYYIMMLLPGSGIIQHGMISRGNDRYAYFPYFITVPLLGSLLESTLNRISNTLDKKVEDEDKVVLPKRDRPKIMYCLFVFFIPITAFSYVSSKQYQIWRDDTTLFKYSIRTDRTDWRMLDSYADYLISSGRISECHRYWNLTLEYMPKHTLKGKLLYAKIIMLKGKKDEACEIYDELMRKYPTNTHTLNNVGLCMISRKKIPQAILLFESSINQGSLINMDSIPRENLSDLLKWDGKSVFQGRLMW